LHGNARPVLTDITRDHSLRDQALKLLQTTKVEEPELLATSKDEVDVQKFKDRLQKLKDAHAKNS
jgi:hypothetical protein